MSDVSDGAGLRHALSPQPPKGFRNRLIASRRFQALAARLPILRGLVRRDGEALFDLMAGFCHSQILMALAELKIPDALLAGPLEVSDVAERTQVPFARLQVLLQGGAAIGLLKLKNGKVRLTRRGAAFASVPGLSAMVRHHHAFYRDLENPVAFFRGETETELAGVWPYVLGGASGIDADTAAAYSDLMAQSLALVAEDTLRMVDFNDAKMLMDVGGGSGAFLAAVGKHYPELNLRLFDLPVVVPAAKQRFADQGLSERSDIVSGSFQDGGLPAGADVISLVRVLYDHSDESISQLLAKVYAALPEGGRLIISEPMSGGNRPDKATDAYFALYTLAMRTGRTRSAKELSVFLAQAGFQDLRTPRSPRPFVTSVITATKAPGTTK